MNTASLAALGRTARVEDPEALIERAFRAHYAGLVAFAARHTRSVADAEELVQDVFLAMWRRRTSLPPEGAVKAYLYKATYHRALNAIRNAHSGMRSLERFSASMSDVSSPAPDLVFEGAEQQRLVAAAVARLPERCRMVFTLSREQGLTYPEIASVMGISVKTVEAQMGRALRHLRDALSGLSSE